MDKPCAGKKSIAHTIGPLAAFLSVLGTIAAMPVAANSADCESDANGGVDWSACNKRLLMLGGSNLDGANLSAVDFTYTDLRNSSMKKADFSQAKLVRTAMGKSTMQAANFNKAEAYRADFSDAQAEHATFIAGEFQRANFRGTRLDNTNFAKAELGRADFEKATLTGSRFTLANLSRARLRNVVFTGPVDFKNAFMLFTRIEGVDLSAATGLDQDQIALACGDDKTKLPEGLTKPASWPCKDDTDSPNSD